jgi:hypothetical protein
LKGVLLQPDFRPDRDSGIAKLIASMKSFAGRGFGSEKNQLRTAIKECIAESELRDFFDAAKERKEFFSKGKILKVQKISLDSPNADILREIADRVYELRCRIVHTKASDDTEIEPLLPYTVEEANLSYDIELLNFIAARISRPAVACSLCHRAFRTHAICSAKMLP